jgi:hypothetical protein
MKWWKLAGLAAVLLAAAALVWLGSAGRGGLNQGGNDPWFVDVTARAGINFVQDAGDLRKYHVPQIHGSGLAVFDFDGDGLLDIYLLTHGGPQSSSTNRLYRNLGDGTFKDVTAGSGLDIAGFNCGVAIGDVNNDGRPDVLITQLGGVKLLLNRGDGTFADVTEEAGLANPAWGTSASFFDYDRDGWLDLVVVNYLEFDPTRVCPTADGKPDFCGPLQFPGTVTRLFRNRTGEDKAGRVRFQDVTVKAGLAKSPGPGLGVYCADFNGDGWPDIFIANDAHPNYLWINNQNGTFTEEASLAGLAVDGMGKAQAGMGVAAGDIDGTARLSIYVTHLTTEHNTLWQERAKRGLFEDRTAAAGLMRTDWRGTGFGTVMGDFDQDGWLDIAVVNGRVQRGSTTPNPDLGPLLQAYSERNQLFRNDGSGRFHDVSRANAPFCGTPNVARGLAKGDLFGDGALDLVVSTVAGAARVYRNSAKNRGHWLLVRALDPVRKRDAYGAAVTVRAGGRELVRIINPADSYQSSSDPRGHFGLGSAAQYDAIHVLWPDGLAEVFPAGQADRQLVLRRGEGSAEGKGTRADP